MYSKMYRLPLYIEIFIILFFIGVAYILFYPAFSSIKNAGETARKGFDKRFRKRFPELFKD